MKQIVINFSELNDEAKKKYLKFLADNKINLENQTIRKPSMPQQHRARQYSTLSDIGNSKAFTPARTSKQPSQHIKTDYSVGNKFSELEDYYPSILNKIANKDLLSRPLKLNLNELCLLIEEIYQKKFIEDSNLIAKNQKIQEIPFVDYVYEFLQNKLKHSKNQQIINFLASVDLHSLKRKDINIFQQFLRKNKQEVLTFFLFARAVIQKELKLSFYHPLKKQSIDCNIIQLNTKQIQSILLLLFGTNERYLDFKKICSNQNVNVSEFSYAILSIYEQQHQTHKQQPFQVPQRSFSPLQFPINDNFDFKQPESPLFMQSETTVDYKPQNEQFFSVESQNNQISTQKKQQWKVKLKFKKLINTQNMVQKQINSILELKLSDFIEEILSEMEDLTDAQKSKCINGVEERIEDIVTSLLDAIYKYDKLIWFKKLNKQPDDVGLEYIENLQKQYRQLVKSQKPLEEQIDQICTLMMQTPDLAKRVGNELLQYFYKCE